MAHDRISGEGFSCVRCLVSCCFLSSAVPPMRCFWPRTVRTTRPLATTRAGHASARVREPTPLGRPSNGLTHIYIGNGWVLTADHVGVSDFKLAGQIYPKVSGSGVPTPESRRQRGRSAHFPDRRQPGPSSPWHSGVRPRIPRSQYARHDDRPRRPARRGNDMEPTSASQRLVLDRYGRDALGDQRDFGNPR